jgi:tripartite-type tricarboxylate transporter receptor subunit TctC
MRRFALCIAAILLSQGAQAQPYPTKAIRMIMPFAPGGGVEAQARVVAWKLAESLGQPVVIDSRPGANGIVGTRIAAAAAPDGYTLLFTNSSFATVSILSPGQPSFDPVRDFAAVIQLGVQPQVLVAHPSLPEALRDVLAAARERPGRLNYASAGSTSQLTMELLKSLAKVDLVHVPYKGSAPAVTAILGGEVQCAIFSVNVILPHVKAGRLRALGVTSKKRAASLPEVPAIAEAGVPGYETIQWSGVLAPARTPRAVIARLNAEAGRALAVEDVRQRLANLGVEPAGGSPAEFADYLGREIAQWSRLIRETGLKVE